MVTILVKYHAVLILLSPRTNNSQISQINSLFNRKFTYVPTQISLSWLESHASHCLAWYANGNTDECQLRIHQAVERPVRQLRCSELSQNLRLKSVTRIASSKIHLRAHLITLELARFISMPLLCSAWTDKKWLLWLLLGSLEDLLCSIDLFRFAANCLR